MNRTVTFACGLILVWLLGYLLMAGRGLLIPLIIALFIWNLLNTLNSTIQRVPLVGARLPNWISMVFSIIVMGLLVKMLIDIITNNVTDVINASPRYQENLMNILDRVDERFNIKLLTTVENYVQTFSVRGMFIHLYSMFTTVMSSAVLIMLYVGFLFVEQHYFINKINALFPQTTHRELIDSIIMHIAKDTQTYLGIKTLTSLITATACWLIMRWAGLDFAEFWALLIFFLNYIPSIGSILSTMFPALLALVQFSTWGPFIFVTTGIVVVQFSLGSLIEPRFLSKSLNLSPLVILFALGVWGTIWGVIGMFLAVPITVILMIIFAHFAATRPIAVLLSQDGCIQNNYATIK